MNPQRAAGILPAEEAWLCRRHVGSTLLGRTSLFAKVHGPDARPMFEVEAFNETACSAGWQPAVSPTGSRQRSRSTNPRYSRLPV